MTANGQTVRPWAPFLLFSGSGLAVGCPLLHHQLKDMMLRLMKARNEISSTSSYLLVGWWTAKRRPNTNTILTTAQRLFSRGAQENESFSVGWAVVKIVFGIVVVVKIESQGVRKVNQRGSVTPWDSISNIRCKGEKRSTVGWRELAKDSISCQPLSDLFLPLITKDQDEREVETVSSLKRKRDRETVSYTSFFRLGLWFGSVFSFSNTILTTAQRLFSRGAQENDFCLRFLWAGLWLRLY